MNKEERGVILQYIANECAKDPTLPSDIYKAVTAGLIVGLEQERKKSSDLAYTLVSVAGLAQGSKVMKNRLLRYKDVMQAGWRTLYKSFASAPIQKTLSEYLLPEENQDD